MQARVYCNIPCIEVTSRVSLQRPWEYRTGERNERLGETLGNGETTMRTKRVAGRMRETVALNVTSDAGHDMG